MFKNMVQKNNAYIFKRILSDVNLKDCNNFILLKSRICCYPILVNVDQRYACNCTISSSAYNGRANKQAFLFSQHVRSKTTIVEEKKSGKKENDIDLAKTEEINVKIKDLNEPNLTRAQQFKKAVKEYGSTVVIFHIGISLLSLGTCYLLVSSGLDVTKVFAMLGLEEWLSKSQVAASAGTFAVAYAVHKVFAPVRMAITLASVPLIVRYLRRIGFLKK